jgi:hypothetical protein
MVILCLTVKGPQLHKGANYCGRGRASCLQIFVRQLILSSSSRSGESFQDLPWINA